MCTKRFKQNSSRAQLQHHWWCTGFKRYLIFHQLDMLTINLHWKYVLYTTVLIPFLSFSAQLQPTHLVLIIRIGIIHIFNVRNYFWIVPGSTYYCKLGLLQALRLSVRTLIISGLVIWSNAKAPNYLVEKQSIARAPLQQSMVGIRNVSAIFQQSY